MQEWQVAVHAAWGGRSPYAEMLVGLGCIVAVHALVQCRFLLDRWRWHRYLQRARDGLVD